MASFVLYLLNEEGAMYMNWQENKLEISVIMGLGITLFGLFSLFRPMSAPHGFGAKDITYEMARPNSFTPGEYDLSQREIDRRYINPFEKVEAPTSANGKKAVTAVAKKADAKKAKDKKTQASNKKKPTSSVNVVDGRKNTLSDSEEQKTAATNPPFNQQNQNNNNTDKNAKDDQKKDGRSPDQWRALLLAEPTYENMKALMAAYSDKQIDDGNFYKIIQSLLENQNAQTQSVGLYGAQSFPSVQSFSLIVKSEDVLSGNSKKFAEEILLGYNQPQSISILGQVLRSNDDAIVMKAGDVILAGIQKYKKGESISEGNRTTRGDVKIRSASQYSVLIPILQQLSANQNTPVSQLAGSVLSQIQSLLASAPGVTLTPS